MSKYKTVWKGSFWVSLLTTLCLLFSLVGTNSIAKKEKVEAAQKTYSIRTIAAGYWIKDTRFEGNGLMLLCAVMDILDSNGNVIVPAVYCGDAFKEAPGTDPFGTPASNDAEYLISLIGRRSRANVVYNEPVPEDNAMLRKLAYYSFGGPDGRMVSWFQRGGRFNNLYITRETNSNSLYNKFTATDTARLITQDLMSVARNGGNYRENTSSKTGSSHCVIMSSLPGVGYTVTSYWNKYLKPVWDAVAALPDPAQYGYEAVRYGGVAGQPIQTGGRGTPQDLIGIRKKPIVPQVYKVTSQKEKTVTRNFNFDIYKKTINSLVPIQGQKARVYIKHGNETQINSEFWSNAQGKFVFSGGAPSVSKKITSDKFEKWYCTNWNSLSATQKQEYAYCYGSQADAQEAADTAATNDLNTKVNNWLKQTTSVTVEEVWSDIKPGYYVMNAKPILKFELRNSTSLTMVVNSTTKISGTPVWTNGNSLINSPSAVLEEIWKSTSLPMNIVMTGNLKKVSPAGTALAGSKVEVYLYDDYAKKTGGVRIGVMQSGSDGIFRPTSDWNAGNLKKTYNTKVYKEIYVKNWDAISQEQRDWIKANTKYHSTKKSAEDKAQADANTEANQLRSTYINSKKAGLVFKEIQAPTGYEIGQNDSISVQLNTSLASDGSNKVDCTKSFINTPKMKTTSVSGTVDLNSYVDIDINKVDKRTREGLNGGTFEVWVNKTGKDASLTKIGSTSAVNGKVTGHFTFEQKGVTVVSDVMKYLDGVSWDSLPASVQQKYISENTFKDKATADAKATENMNAKKTAMQADFEKVARKVEIREVTAPNSYKVVGTGKVEQTITVNHKITGTLENEGTEYIIVSKLDSKGVHIPGAKLKISINGKDLETWTTDSNAHKVVGLTANTKYVITEINPAQGYVNPTKKTIEFTTGNLGTNNTCPVKNSNFKVSKQTLGSAELPGASLKVYEKTTNKVVDEWTSTKDPHMIKNLEEGKTYILRETLAPLGYNRASQIEFTVGNNDQIIKMVDGVTLIRKNDTAGNRLAGAVLQVKTKAGQVLDEWTTVANGDHYANGLVVGEEYILHEKTAPAGYGLAEDVTFVVKSNDITTVTMIDANMQAHKYIAGTNTELAGAGLQVIDNTGKLIDSWTSDGNQHAIRNIVLGREYTLQEVKVPEGYIKANDVKFTPTNAIKTVAMYDNYVEVRKKDTANKEIAGATLRVVDSAGAKVDEWVTTTTPHKVKGLTAGQKYKLMEVQAPSGYVRSSEVKEFTAVNTNSPIVLTMLNTKTSVTKSDLANKPLAGAKLTVIDRETQQAVDTWDSTGDAHDIKNLVQGRSYILRETSAPAGYTMVRDVEFIAGEDNKDKTIPLKDGQSKVVKKTTEGQPLAGARLQIKEKATGKVVDEWTSTTEAHNISGIRAGVIYVLHEVSAPEGYGVADDIEFTASDTSATLEMIDVQTTVLKTDTKGTSLPGAKLRVKDNTGKVIDEWTSDSKEHPVKGTHVGSSYTIEEILAPDGFVIAPAQSFTAQPKALKLKVIDTSVSVSKKDLSGAEIAGAELQVTDSTGKVVDKWTSTTTEHRVKGLIQGQKYKLTENLAPIGYTIASTIEFTAGATDQHIDMIDTINEVSKEDVGGKEIAGAKLKVTEKATGKVMDEWTSTTEKHRIKNLKVGGVYILHEDLAPVGYTIANDIEFTVGDKDTVIKMVDTQSFMKKVDVGGEEVEGAKIQVIDKDGNVVDEWISTKEEHAIKNLKAGEEYTLHEEVAPNGYVYASDFKFTAGTDTNNHYKMVDTIQTVYKKDAQGRLVRGAEMQLIDKTSGEVVDSWTSGAKVVNLSKEQSFMLSSLGQDVVFDKDGNHYEVKASTKMEIVKSETKTDTDKQEESKETEDKESTENAEVEYQYLMVVTSEAGEKSYYYVDETGAEAGHRVSNAYALKDYIVREVEAPQGYVKALDIEVAPNDKLDTEDSVIDKQVQFTKEDITGDEVEGAKIKIIETETDKVVDEWISEKKPHYIENLEVGKKYKLIEEITPNGYTQASAIDFELTDDGLDAHYKMVDAIHRVIKVDENERPVKNARIAIYTKDKKKKIDEWVTGQHIVDLPVEKILEAKLAGEAKLDEHEAIATFKEEDIAKMKANVDKALEMAYPDLDNTPEEKTDEDNQDKATEDEDEEMQELTADDYIKLAFEGLNTNADELNATVDKGIELLHQVTVEGGKNKAEDIRQELYTLIEDEAKKANEVIKTSTEDLTGLYLRVNDQSAGGYTLVNINKDGTMKYTDIDEFGDEANHRISGMVAGEEYILKEVQSPTGFQLAPEMVFEADPSTDLKMTMIDRAIVEIATGVRIKPTTYVLIATISLFTLFTLSGYFLHRKRVNASR